MILSRGRRRHVDTSGHFCPRDACAYHGQVGCGNIRANGHPNGRRGRQLYCLGRKGYFLDTPGPPFHAKQVEIDKLVWASAALAEGLGIRAVARVFAVDPNTVLGWLVEAAEHLEAFSRYFLHDVDVEQVQMDELFALRSAGKDGEVTETQAIECLSQPLGGASTPGANTQRAYVSSWRCSKCTTISYSLTPACVCHYHCPSPSMGRAQSNSGSHGHRPWPSA
jgi:hypothetical protein